MQLGVVVEKHPDVDASARTTQTRGRLTGILERLPGHLEQQPLLRVHVDGFPRGDIEEVRIEPVDVAQEAADARVHLAGRFGVAIEEEVLGPPLGRDLLHRVDAVSHQPPESVRIIGVPRKATTHPYDRNGLFRAGLRGVELLAELQAKQLELLGREVRYFGIEVGHGRAPPRASRSANRRSASSSLRSRMPARASLASFDAARVGTTVSSASSANTSVMR